VKIHFPLSILYSFLISFLLIFRQVLLVKNIFNSLRIALSQRSLSDFARVFLNVLGDSRIKSIIRVESTFSRWIIDVFFVREDSGSLSVGIQFSLIFQENIMRF
jgi:hypothetical protein